ncbi:hypothetical protein BRC88_00860 [Halobacteriales archaeon QS_4_69_225]|nr:MAG: hypothetical protein BRC88_00860 [Halobacteriales archaeon QS_4_69_225]
MNGDRVSVQTYVPAGQRDRWREEAEGLDMSQAEYVRTMVQAGRRGFDLADEGDEPTSPDATPGVDGLKSRVLAVLEEQGAADWDALLAGVTDDIEERLDETLEELQDENRVLHSGRQGGYTVVEDGR